MKSLSPADRFIRTISLVFGGSSVVFGSLVVITILTTHKLKTKPTFILIFRLASVEVLNSLGFFIFFDPPADRSWQCNLEAFWLQYFSMASVCWSFVIARYMLVTVTLQPVSQTPVSSIDKAKAFAFAQGFPLLLAGLPFITYQYSDLGSHCWIAEGENGRSYAAGVALRFICQYGICWAVCLYEVYAYAKIRQFFIQRALSSAPQSAAVKRAERQVNNLLYYPAVMLISWSGLTACRIFNSVKPSAALPTWAFAGAIALNQAQGLLDCFVFFMNPSARAAFMDLWRSQAQTGRPIADERPTDMSRSTITPIGLSLSSNTHALEAPLLS